MPDRSAGLYRIHRRTTDFERMPIAACMGCLMPTTAIPKGSNMAANNSSIFLPQYMQLYQFLLRTLVPKHGDKSMVRSFPINLMASTRAVFDSFELGLVPRPIDVADFL